MSHLLNLMPLFIFFFRIALPLFGFSPFPGDQQLEPMFPPSGASGGRASEGGIRLVGRLDELGFGRGGREVSGFVVSGPKGTG